MFSPLGEKFDPNFHQAMYEVPDSDAAPGTVAQVIQAGYLIGERVLRPAMVAIVKGRAETTTRPPTTTAPTPPSKPRVASGPHARRLQHLARLCSVLISAFQGGHCYRITKRGCGRRMRWKPGLGRLVRWASWRRSVSASVGARADAGVQPKSIWVAGDADRRLGRCAHALKDKSGIDISLTYINEVLDVLRGGINRRAELRRPASIFRSIPISAS